MVLSVVLVGPLLVFPNRYTPLALFLLPVLTFLVVACGCSRRTPLDAPILLFLAIAFLSSLLALDPSLGMDKLGGVVFGAAVYYALKSFEPNERNLRLITLVVLATGAAIALASALGTAWVTYKMIAPLALYERLPRLFASAPGSLPAGFHPNEVGGTLALFVPFSLAILARGGRALDRNAACLAFLICLGVLVLSQSRSALFGAAIASFLVLAVLNVWLRFLAVAGGLGVVGWLAIQGAEGLKLSLMTFDQASSHIGSVNFATRLEIWQRALYVLRDFPFTGIGLGSFPDLVLARYPFLLAEVYLPYGHAHNIFLETAVDFGFVGLLAVLVLLGTFGLMLRRAWSVKTNKLCSTLALGIGSGLLAHLLFELTDAVNWGAKPGFVVWIYLGTASLIWVGAGRPPLLPLPILERRPAIGLKPVPGSMVRFATIGVVAALLVGALATLRDPLLSAFNNSLAARELGRLALVGVEGKRETLQRQPASSISPSLTSRSHSWLIERLNVALQQDPGNAAALRNLAAVNMAVGQPEMAALALRKAVEREPGNLLVAYELAIAYSSAGQTDSSLPLYRSLMERFPGNDALKRAEADDYALHHLGRGVERLVAGDPVAAQAELRRALEGRPGDLFASVYLARALAASGDGQEAVAVRDELRNFALTGDDRVYGRYLADVLPDLVRQGFVDSGQLSRLASYLLWQGNADAATPILDLLARARPQDKSTWILKARLDARLGELENAAAALERARDLDPMDAEVHFQLGQLLETNRPDVSLAAYRRALEIAPDHLIALHRAAVLAKNQGQSIEAQELRDRLSVLADDTRAVAGKLGLAGRDVRLTPVPLASNFRVGHPQPVGWRWATWVGGRYFGRASYVGGIDEQEVYHGNPSLRIAGIWAERRPQSGNFWLAEPGGKELARAGFWAPMVALDGNSLYALSFSYKTADLRNGSAQVRIYAPELDGEPTDSLPGTDGMWRRRTLIVANQRLASLWARPLFLSWGVGDVWFADVRLSKVTFDPLARPRMEGVALIK